MHSELVGFFQLGVLKFASFFSLPYRIYLPLINNNRRLFLKITIISTFLIFFFTRKPKIYHESFYSDDDDTLTLPAVLLQLERDGESSAEIILYILYLSVSISGVYRLIDFTNIFFGTVSIYLWQRSLLYSLLLYIYIIIRARRKMLH